jgi:hypothetical protein
MPFAARAFKFVTILSGVGDVESFGGLGKVGTVMPALNYRRWTKKIGDVRDTGAGS